MQIDPKMQTGVRLDRPVASVAPHRASPSEARPAAAKRVVVYARVSTADQDCEPQLRDLREYVAARGWRAVEFIHQGVSGARERGPALDPLLAEVRPRKADVAVAPRADAAGRSVRHPRETLDRF